MSFPIRTGPGYYGSDLEGRSFATSASSYRRSRSGFLPRTVGSTGLGHSKIRPLPETDSSRAHTLRESASTLILTREYCKSRLLRIALDGRGVEQVKLDLPIAYSQIGTGQLRPATAVVVSDGTVAPRRRMMGVPAAYHAAALLAGMLDGPFLDLAGTAQ